MELSVLYSKPEAANLVSREILRLWREIDPDMERRPVVLCIGSDRSTGDSLGPLTGTFLSRNFSLISVYGTLHEPVHALNLKQVANDIKLKFPHGIIIAVDSSISTKKKIGSILVGKVNGSGFTPGSGAGKRLPQVGDIYVAGVVNNAEAESYLNHILLHTTSLGIVWDMAEVIAAAIADAIDKTACLQLEKDAWKASPGVEKWKTAP